MHHEPSLDGIQTLSGRGRVPSLAAHGVGGAAVEVRCLWLPVQLVIHDDGVRGLRESGSILFRQRALVHIFLSRASCLGVQRAHLPTPARHQNSLRAVVRHRCRAKLVRHGQMRKMVPILFEFHFPGHVLRVSIIGGNRRNIL